MNKKGLVTVLTLVLLTTSLIGVVEAKSRCCDTQEFNVKIFGGIQEPVWTKAIPKCSELTKEDGVYTDPKLKIVKTKTQFIVIDGASDPATSKVVVMIGDEEFSSADNEIAFGGTYFGKLYNPTSGAHDFAKYYIKWWIKFNPDTTGIDGSIIVKTNGLNSMTNTPTSGGAPPTINDRGEGYGTGDLAGVKTYDRGFLVFDPTGAGVWVEHAGIVKCWPDIQYFKMVISGGPDTETGNQWVCPPAPAEAKSVHTRNREWVIGDVLTLTVGSDTWVMGGDPVDLRYYGTFDSDLRITEDGNFTKVRVNEIYSIFYMGKKIGALKLFVRSEITPTGAGGKVWGYGTGYFKGVRIKADDVVNIIPGDPVIYELARIGKIINWPGLPA